MEGNLLAFYALSARTVRSERVPKTVQLKRAVLGCTQWCGYALCAKESHWRSWK